MTAIKFEARGIGVYTVWLLKSSAKVYLGQVVRFRKSKWQAFDAQGAQLSSLFKARLAAGQALRASSKVQAPGVFVRPAVDYDIPACDRFLKELLACSSNQIKQVWLTLTEQPFAEQVAPRWGDGYTAMRFANTWTRLSLWNRQKILYDLVPIIQGLGLAAARAVADRARVEEPL